MTEKLNITELQLRSKLVHKDVRLSEADTLLSDYFELHEDEFENGFHEAIYEEGEDYGVMLSRAYIHIPALKAKGHEYLFFRGTKDESSGETEYHADYSGWIFFDEQTAEAVYEEGYTSFSSAVLNGFNCNAEGILADIYA
jgi:hypothetical protein